MLSILCALVALIALMSCVAVRVARTMTGERGAEARRRRPPVRSRQRGPGHKCARPSDGKTVGCRLNIFQGLKPLANNLRPSGPQSDQPRSHRKSGHGGCTQAHATSDLERGGPVVGEEQTTRRPAGRPRKARPLSRGPPGRLTPRAKRGQSSASQPPLRKVGRKKAEVRVVLPCEGRIQEGPFFVAVELVSHTARPNVREPTPPTPPSKGGAAEGSGLSQHENT